MKKVREDDVINLIENFYCKFIAHTTISQHYDLPHCERVKVNVKSTHVKVWWYFDEELDSKCDTETFIKGFAEEIEKITFGNLKVTYYGIGKIDEKEIFEIYIANAYEVIK